MRVRTKLIVVILFVALAPVAVSAWTTLDVHQEAFDGKVGELQLVSATYGATLAQTQLEDATRGLAGIVQRSTHWPSLTPEEREGAGWLVFSQMDETAAVMVVDGADRPLLPMAFIPPSVDDPEWEKHPHLAEDVLDEIRAQLPIDRAREDGTAVGDALFMGDQILLPLAFAVEGETPGAIPWVVGVAVSMGSICAQIIDNRPPDTREVVWDARGRALCASDVASEVPFDRIAGGARGTFRHQPAGGEELLAAVATTSSGWSVVIEQPAAAALAPGRRIQFQTLLWIALGVLAALITGTILSRGITEPLGELERGARRVAAGDYESKINIDSKDELAELAEAFNAMSREIQAWNTELMERVEGRTRELKAAQTQLIEARKLGAMASLSAGVAHEINNPLASVLAFTQLLLSKARKADSADKQVRMLETVETEAHRIQDIVSRMQRLSQEQTSAFSSVEPHEILDAVLTRMEHALEEASIEVDRAEHGELPPVRGNSEQLATALEYVCDNAIKAMGGDERRLRLGARGVDGELVVFEVTDTGRGMAPEHLERVLEPFYTTKEGDWRGVGLGLSVAHRIVTNHGGSMRIESAVGLGTTVSITLPASTAEAHLA